ncbi:tetraspanin-16-like [Chanos chanos]|uniref:Tetraspanin n=1 Tax=Chanos chanos TaxID=29144 RepID=A0A6J2VSW6_CHACN|nr:tetraspanin-16-like [Chanos chanos]
MTPFTHLYGLLRRLLMFLSVVVLAGGSAVLCLGLWLKYGAVAFIEVMGSSSSRLVGVSYICMGVGGALCLLGVIGYCGAWKESRLLLMLYFIIISMMVVGQIIGIIFVLIYKAPVIMLLKQAGKESLTAAYVGPGASDPISTAWNTIFTTYKCCGFENSTEDFESSLFSANTGLLYPRTCCVDMTSSDCDGLNTTQSLLHSESCMEKLVGMFEEKSVRFGYIAATVGIVELASMFVSVMLFIRLTAFLFV